MENSLKSMVLTLLIITLIASAAVSAVYSITKEPIAMAREAARREAIEIVTPEFDSLEVHKVSIDGVPITVNSAYKDSLLVGYAIESTTRQGYSGEFSIMAGLTPDTEVLTVNILSHKETPGLGSKMAEMDNALLRSVTGRDLNKFELSLRKDGGEVDGLTAATITSRAYLDALGRAHRAVEMINSVEQSEQNETLIESEIEVAEENNEDENSRAYYDYGKAFITSYIK